MTSQTTKQCQCGSTRLVEMTSLSLKWCGDCGRWINWKRDEDQPPLIGPARKVKGGK